MVSILPVAPGTVEYRSLRRVREPDHLIAAALDVGPTIFRLRDRLSDSEQVIYSQGSAVTSPFSAASPRSVVPFDDRPWVGSAGTRELVTS